ncbi:hypothetical protein [Salinispora pacifica]|uniref:hypothetical protein n=1 Tax=Salinispora pacifica TaxID=351187 RepID=UPI002FC3ACB8
MCRVRSPTDRSASAGEARGLWLHAIAWPASAGRCSWVVKRDLSRLTRLGLRHGAPPPDLAMGLTSPSECRRTDTVK